MAESLADFPDKIMFEITCAVLLNVLSCCINDLRCEHTQSGRLPFSFSYRFYTDVVACYSRCLVGGWVNCWLQKRLAVACEVYNNSLDINVIELNCDVCAVYNAIVVTHHEGRRCLLAGKSISISISTSSLRNVKNVFKVNSLPV